MNPLDKLISFSHRLTNSGCNKCSARSPTRTCIPRSFYVPGKTSATPILVVLSHPRESDEVGGRLLMGAERKTLLRWLSFLSYPAIYFTAAVKCRSENDREPKKTEINVCSTNHLIYEIALLQPKVIIAMGKVAVKALFNCTDKAASDMMLTRVEHKIRDQDQLLWRGAIYTVYHPAYFQMGAGDHDADEVFCIDTLIKAIEENNE